MSTYRFYGRPTDIPPTAWNFLTGGEQMAVERGDLSIEGALAVAESRDPAKQPADSPKRTRKPKSIDPAVDPDGAAAAAGVDPTAGVDPDPSQGPAEVRHERSDNGEAADDGED